MNQLVQEHSKSPDINGVVVLLLKDHLWSHILIGPAKCFTFHLNIISCPSKVTYLDVVGTI